MTNTAPASPAAPTSVRAQAEAYVAARTPITLTLSPGEKALVAALLVRGRQATSALTMHERFDLDNLLLDLGDRLGVDLGSLPGNMTPTLDALAWIREGG